MKKTDIKAVGTVVVGGIITGLLMYHLRGIAPIAQARAGYSITG